MGGTWIEFENRIPRRMFGTMREEIVGGWKRLHNEYLRNLYASPNYYYY
jgi:hypothetical protein